MIELTCAQCQRSYRLPDAAAGRQAKCRCGQLLSVPPAAAPPTSPQAGAERYAASPRVPSKPPMRIRRLRADAQEVARLFADFPPIAVRPLAGDPPEAYVVDYSIRSLELTGNKPSPRLQHQVEIRLTADYPRLSPQCKMLTPIFHPNIDAAALCVGDHWTAGERLADLIVRIGQMLAYQDYNIKSPLNAEAAMWADLHPDQLPTDHQNLYPPGAEGG